MIGKCLCGGVQFEIGGELPDLYQCHCSLCRKVSGSSSNTATLVEADQFKWISGDQTISSFAAASGFRSDFCSRCGCPVPNELKTGKGYWIPVGLLEETSDAEIVAHVYVGSKACWHAIGGDAAQYKEMPDTSKFGAMLQGKSSC